MDEIWNERLVDIIGACNSKSQIEQEELILCILIETVRSIKTILFISLLVVFLCSCAARPSKTALTVNFGPPVQYRSESGEQFVARYGSLSDGSLHFVKLTMPDGQEYTLPQVISGSGVRYTDEREIVWWTHQGTVRVDVRDAEGKWTTRYSELKEVQKGN